MAANPQQHNGSTTRTTTHIRDLDSDSVLGREEEREHAETLQDARERFVALVQALPEEVRALALAGSEPPARAPRKWPLVKLDACFRKLTELGPNVPIVAEVLPAAARHKRRIDHARDALALGTLWLVPLIVNRTGFDRALFFDLVQEGNIGLMEAFDRFEPERGLRFGTYAGWWIRRAILRYVADNRRMIAIPDRIARLIRELDAIALELRETLGREPSDEELAARMGTAPERVRQLRTDVRSVWSLEHAFSADDGMTLMSRLSDDTARDPLEDILGQELRAALIGAVEQLTSREQSVVRRRFGLDRQLPVSLHEIGAALGVSKERVRKIEVAALRKMWRSLVRDARPAIRRYLSKPSTTRSPGSSSSSRRLPGSIPTRSPA